MLKCNQKRGKIKMYKESFHERIKQARIDTGFTQREVANETGISQSIIAHIETGNREPSLENLGKLIDFYGIDANWIIGTGKRKTHENNN